MDDVGVDRVHGRRIRLFQLSLPNALYFALTNAFPDEDEFPDAAEAAIVLAVEEPWVEDTRRLVTDQDELARLWLAEEK